MVNKRGLQWQMAQFRSLKREFIPCVGTGDSNCQFKGVVVAAGTLNEEIFHSGPALQRRKAPIAQGGQRRIGVCKKTLQPITRQGHGSESIFAFTLIASEQVVVVESTPKSVVLTLLQELNEATRIA